MPWPCCRGSLGILSLGTSIGFLYHSSVAAFVQTKNDILQVQGVPQKIIFGIYRKSYKLAAPRKGFYLATFFLIYNKRLLRQKTGGACVYMPQDQGMKIQPICPQVMQNEVFL